MHLKDDYILNITCLQDEKVSTMINQSPLSTLSHTPLWWITLSYFLALILKIFVKYFVLWFIMNIHLYFLSWVFTSVRVGRL